MEQLLNTTRSQNSIIKHLTNKYFLCQDHPVLITKVTRKDNYYSCKFELEGDMFELPISELHLLPYRIEQDFLELSWEIKKLEQGSWKSKDSQGRFTTEESKMKWLRRSYNWIDKWDKLESEMHSTFQSYKNAFLREVNARNREYEKYYKHNIRVERERV